MAAPAPDATVSVTFYTDPPGAQVYHEVSGHPQLLGLSGHPIPVDIRPFQDTHGNFLGNADLTFKLAGHKDEHRTVKPDLWAARRWPVDGVVHLQPIDAATAFDDWYRAHRVAILVILAVGAILLAAAVRAFLRQRSALARARILETYKADASNDPWIASRLGRYRIAEKIGAGGMAVVYKAFPDDSLGDEDAAVAVKVIHAEAAENEEFRERFKREIQISHQLQHPNIVRLIDWGSDTPLYIAMEFVAGVTLRSRMEMDGAIPVPQAAGWLRPIMGALEYAHGQGIVHRDLKPDNVMVTSRNDVKIMDFGLARSLQVDRKLTRTGAVLGTPAYMAPEQIHGDLHPASDQYALGIIAYELLAGRHPFFDTDDMVQMLINQLNREPPSLRTFKPEVPAQIETVILRMMAKKPQDRYPTMAEALEALDAALA